MTTLYRAWASDGRLLYVGVTDDLTKRILTHANRRALWIPIMESLSIERYTTRQEALADEREAIRTEWPLYNVEHSIDPVTPRRQIRNHEMRPLQMWDPTEPPEETEARFQRSWREHCRIHDAIRLAEYEALGIRSKPRRFGSLVTVV